MAVKYDIKYTDDLAAAAHKRQREYVAKIDSHEIAFGGLTVGSQFLESMRDLGYRSTGHAINEAIDNAIEAHAEDTHIAFGYDGKSRKPSELAIIDNGVGMIPGMLPPAAAWGGTDRAEQRSFLGRYGYGLPAAAVSQGRRFSVFSRTSLDEPFWMVKLDLDEIADGFLNVGGRIEPPTPEKSEMPDWVVTYANEHFPGGADAVRTVVVIEKLDRLTYKQADKLQNHLLEVIGLTYRNYLRSVRIAVNGRLAEPVDPLFLTPDARFYDLDDERAEPVEPIVIPVKDSDTKEVLGDVSVRMSYMPPTFQRRDKDRDDSKLSNMNERFPIMRDHQGLVVTRAGRQIDVATRVPKTVFVNYDRNIGIELDFPPALDEFFGVTTAKQQITIDERIWTLLDQHGVWATLRQLRKRLQEDIADGRAKWGDDVPDKKRPSEVAIEEAQSLDPAPPPTKRRHEINMKKRDEAIQDLVKRGVDPAEAEKAVDSQSEARPFRIELEHNPEGPFYRVEMRGGQTAVLLNRAHRFYTDVYARLGGREGEEVRQALEVLLFVLGQAELTAEEDRELFYEAERMGWSIRLNTALAKLREFTGEPGEAPVGDAEDVPASGEVTTSA